MTEKKRGFAALTAEQIREISRKGGKAAHESGKAHVFSSEEARKAGRLGGKAVHTKRRSKKASESTETI